MSLFAKDIKTLDDLFVHTLRDMYYAEKKILRSLPGMVDKAGDRSLADRLTRHLGETRNHVTRLEQVFEMHGAAAKAIDCPAIDGILKEADAVTGDSDDREVRDAAIIAAAQAVEHYEIARYGTLIAWANQLGRSDCAAVLGETLKEEKAADRTLTDVAESRVNAEAA